MINVGSRIKHRRQELGWTQDVLARNASISKSYLSELENGKRGVGADTLLNIAKSLNLSLDFLMTGDESEPERTKVEIPMTLALFAGKTGLSFRHTLTLLAVRQVIAARRSDTKKGDLERVDWQRFYEAVKDFL